MVRALLLALSLGALSSTARAAEAAGGTAPPDESCTTCHAGLSPQLREPVRLLKAGDVHAAAGVGCGSCHGGDPKGRTALDAHRDTFLLRSGDSETIITMCGRCHKEPAANFRKGPHQLAAYAQRRPDCTTCHGSHGVATASLNLIAEPLCSSCHGIAQARRIHKALSDAEREVADLDGRLAAAGNNEAERTRLKAARSQLRGLSHSLDLISITRIAAQTLATADDVRAKALPHIAGGTGDAACAPPPSSSPP